MPITVTSWLTPCQLRVITLFRVLVRDSHLLALAMELNIAAFIAPLLKKYTTAYFR